MRVLGREGAQETPGKPGVFWVERLPLKDWQLLMCCTINCTGSPQKPSEAISGRGLRGSGSGFGSRDNINLCNPP